MLTCALNICYATPILVSRCRACRAVRVYDGFDDAIINLDNKALFSYELCISYCNEFCTARRRTFHTFW